MSRLGRIVSACDMDAMSAQQRAEVVESGVVRDLAELPKEFQLAIATKAQAIEEELDRSSH